MTDLTPVQQETLDAMREVISDLGWSAVDAWQIAWRLYGYIPPTQRRDISSYQPLIRQRLYVLRDLGLVEKTYGRHWRPTQLGSGR